VDTLEAKKLKIAAKRRLHEELGFTCDLSKVTELSYFLSLGGGMYENEYTHVFAGQYEGDILPNPEEVSNIQWIKPKLLKQTCDLQPDIYSKWLQLYLSDYYYKIFI
jgi:isopentenyl-diphosphate delta-isomerase